MKRTSWFSFLAAYATIAYALGLPLDQVTYSPSMRPFTVCDKGQPIMGIFG